MGGCISVEESDAISVNTSKMALTATQSRVLGFEAPLADWSTLNSGAHLSQSSTASEGANALAVVPANWTEINSVPLSSLGNVGESASVDVRLPQTVVWGEVRLILKIPSLGIWWEELGSQPLTGLSAGVYHRASFAIPSNIAAALEGSYTDLTVVVAVNAPALSAPYLIDKVDFGQVETETDTGNDTDTDIDTDSGTSPASLAIVLPEGLGLHEVAMGTSDSMRVSNYVHVIAPAGGVASLANTGTGEVGLETDAVIDGSIVSVGPVRLSNRAVVHGDVITGGDLVPQDPYTVDGEVKTHEAIPLGRTYAWEIAIPEGGANVSLEPGQSRSLDPGNYGDVSVKPGSTLRLRAGTYYVSSLMADSGSRIEITGDGEPVFLYVKNGFTSRATIVHSRSSSDFLVGYLGTGSVELGEPFAGTMVAPNGSIRLGPLNGRSHQGSFFAKQINAEANTPVYFVPFSHWDFLFPPIITLECISRAARGNSAALFSYNNILGVPVTMPEGLKNYLEGEGVAFKGGPMTDFEPGLHLKDFWVPYIGDSISWTLGDQTVTVDEQTRGCTLADYQLLDPGDEPEDQSPRILTASSALSEGMQPHTPTGDWDFNPDIDDSYVPPSVEAGESFTMYLDNWTWGDDGFGPLDLDLSVRIDDNWWQERLINDDDFTAEGFVVAQRVFTADIPFNVDPIEIEIYYWEWDWNLSGGAWEDYLTVFINVDRQTGEVEWIGAWDEDGDSRKTGEWWRPGWGCAAADGWGFCYRFELDRKAKLCASWQAQFLDSGVGESWYPERTVQVIPASFAMVKLDIDGGAVGFDDWEGYFPLDKDGCVPEEYAPSVAQLVGANLTMKVAGQFRASWDQPSPGQATWQVISDDRDVFSFTHQIANVSPIDGGRMDVTLDGLNEYTKAAAIVSHLMKRQADGKDMGMSDSKDFAIQAISTEAATLKPYATQYHSYGTVYLRGDPSQHAEGGTEWGDASYKFGSGHEIGHGIMWMGTKGWDDIGQSYRFKWIDNGQTKYGDYPPATPEECKCHIQQGYSPDHCIQSVEWPNAAQIEGFANFYGAKLWSNPAEDQGWYNYVKWVYSPNCPDEGNMICHEANTTDQDIVDQLTSMPSASSNVR